MGKYLLLLFIWILTLSEAAQPQTVAGRTGNGAAPSPDAEKEALRLIQAPNPVFKPLPPQAADPALLTEAGFKQVYTNVTHSFVVRDGKKLLAYKYPAAGSRTTIVLLHGVLSGAYLMNEAAGLLRTATGATVYALDLRGHGRSAGIPGDVDYTGQYADDVADVIAAIRQEEPQGKIVLAGHSMGGGIALCYALQEKKTLADGYLLLAPLLGQNAPTIPVAPQAFNTNEEPFLKIHISRIIGLKMLNAAGDHRYDSLPVLFFNLPKEAPLHQYSYRANKSMSPADYKAGLQAVHQPLLVLVGSKDEAFVAAAFPPAIQAHSKGEAVVIDKASHNGIRRHPQAMQAIKDWFLKHQL